MQDKEATEQDKKATMKSLEVTLAIMEAIQHESPFYQDLFQRGFDEGFKMGFKLGNNIRLGRRKEIIEATLEILEDRFPRADVNALSPRLEAITDLDLLKALGRSVTSVTSFETFEAKLAS